MFRSKPLSMIVVASLAAGCANYASYPPLEGDPSAAEATSSPAPEVIATAIEWCVTREDFSEQQAPVDFQLPTGMNETTHEAVIEQLKDGGLDSQPASTGGIEVRSVRIFGLKAMVDLSVPRNGGPNQLVTLELRTYPFQSWRVIGANRWRFNEDHIRQSEAEFRQASADEGS